MEIFNNSNNNGNDGNVNDTGRPPPPIFITSADHHQQQHQPNLYLNINERQSSAPNSPLSTSSSPRLSYNNSNNNQPLSVQTQNLSQQQQQMNMNQYQQSPTYQNAISTPLPPSPCPSSFLSSNEDEHNQMYIPRSPNQQNAYAMDQQQQQYNAYHHP